MRLFNRRQFRPRASEINMPVLSMPLDFYGGKNPVITFRNVAQEVSLAGGSALSQPRSRSSVSYGERLVKLVANRRFLVISAAVLFVVFLALASGYYFWLIRPVKPKAPIATRPVLSTTAPTPVAPPVLPPTSSPEIATPPAATGAPIALLALPPFLLPDSADLDQDGLTNLEEDLFTADPAVADSDGDRYSDSHEIYNLYNPIGKEPIRLIDSALVKEFINPRWQYRLYYPVTWAVGTVDANSDEVLFSTFTGEYISIKVLPKGADETFSDWISRLAPTERWSDLLEFSSVFKESGYRRSDYLVYYFPRSTVVYALSFHPAAESALVNYRLVAKMMARSFRLTAGSQAEPLPERVTEPAASADLLNPPGSGSSTIASGSPFGL